MKNTAKGFAQLYGLTVCIAFIYFSYQFIKKNDFVTYLFFGELVPACQSAVWPYYAWESVAGRDKHKSRPSEESSARFFKKWKISKEDRKRYRISFNELGDAIFNEICRTDENGNFLTPNLYSTPIPYTLQDNFTESAIREQIQRYSIFKIQKYMTDLVADGNWSWCVIREPISSFEYVGKLSVSIHNNSPYTISDITIHISELGRDYKLRTSWRSIFGVHPNQDGDFEVTLSYNTYRYVCDNKCHARITRIWW